MTPREIIQKVRMSPEISDTNEAKVSDWQIVDSLNSVLNMLYNELGTFSNDLLTRTVTLEFEHGKAELPEDFLQMVEVYRGDTVYMPQSKGYGITTYTYVQMNNFIYCPVDRLTIDYRPQFAEVSMEELDKEMDYPAYFKEFIKKLVIMCMSGTLVMPEGLAYLRDTVRSLTANRGYNRLELKGAWTERL